MFLFSGTWVWTSKLLNILSHLTQSSCGICKKNQDQHLLVLCDTCKLYYHLGCLEPPLTRMPKKTKNSYWWVSRQSRKSSSHFLFRIIKCQSARFLAWCSRHSGWKSASTIPFRTTAFVFYRQCSECDQASSDEADIAMETLPDGTKRSRRQIKGPIKFIPQEMSPEPKKQQLRGTVCMRTYEVTFTRQPFFRLWSFHPSIKPA